MSIVGDGTVIAAERSFCSPRDGSSPYRVSGEFHCNQTLASISAESRFIRAESSSGSKSKLSIINISIKNFGGLSVDGGAISLDAIDYFYFSDLVFEKNLVFFLK